MNDENEKNKTEDIIEKSKNISFMICIKKGEIHVKTSGPFIDYIIVNEDDQSIMIKRVKDPFMMIPSVIKSYLEKWKNLQKRIT